MRSMSEPGSQAGRRLMKRRTTPRWAASASTGSSVSSMISWKESRQSFDAILGRGFFVFFRVKCISARAIWGWLSIEVSLTKKRRKEKADHL